MSPEVWTYLVGVYGIVGFPIERKAIGIGSNSNYAFLEVYELKVKIYASVTPGTYFEMQFSRTLTIGTFLLIKLTTRTNEEENL